LKEKGIRLNSNPNYIKNIDYNNLTEVKLPFKKQFLEDGYINLSEWFDYLSDLSQINFYNFDDITYLVIYKEEENKFILNNYKEFNSCLIDEWFESDEIPTYEEDHKFIDFDYYNKLTFEGVSNSLFNNDDAISIMRRNFRDNDLIVNNTKLGNLYTSSWRYVWRQEEIPLQKDKNYIDFKSKRDNKISISKNILTDNGKKLISVLNSIRGYAIKNYKELKNKYKNQKKSKKLTREDIETYINLDFDIILEINNIYYLSYYVYIHLYKNKIELNNDDYTKNNIQFINKLYNIISLLKKMDNKENISLLKSYVTKYKTPNYGDDPIKFYQELLVKLLNNYNSLIKLRDLNNELLDGKDISEEESKKIIYLNKSNRNEYNEYLSELIEKYFNQYNIVIDIPDNPLILGGSIGSSIEKIRLEIKNPPI